MLLEASVLGVVLEDLKLYLKSKKKKPRSNTGNLRKEKHWKISLTQYPPAALK